MGSITQVVGLDGSPKPTIASALKEIGPIPAFLLPVSRPHSSHDNESAALGSSFTTGPFAESRLSTEATRVASAPTPMPLSRALLGTSAQCSETNVVASAQITSSSRNNVAGPLAIDGKLSLSVRPTGWTLGVLGPSIRRLGAGTGGFVNLHCHSITQQVSSAMCSARRE
ncbi:hypothetical protein GGI08_003793 [Coemansia sp. S2]|nr:hypothetical protein GGI08_003793 [Coemansia sp. S2]